MGQLEGIEDVNEDALEVARLAVEDVLIELRDACIGVLGGRNGFIVYNYDSSPSSIMRLTTRDGLRIGIAAYLKAQPQAVASE